MTLHLFHTHFVLFEGTDEEREVRGQLGLVDYEPECLGHGLHPDFPAQYEFEVRDERGFPRPDWYDAMSQRQYDQLTTEALRAWETQQAAEEAGNREIYDDERFSVA